MMTAIMIGIANRRLLKPRKIRRFQHTMRPMKIFQEKNPKKKRAGQLFPKALLRPETTKIATTKF